MMRLCAFDLDGTLIDSLGDLAQATNVALMKYGLPPHPTQAYRYFVGDGVLRLIERAAGEDASSQLVSDLKAEFDRYYREHYHVQTAFYPGIPELLRQLKEAGVRLAVISNKPHEFASKIVEEFAPGLFDRVLGNSSQFPKKPDPTSLLDTMKILGTEPEETLWIGDSDVDMFTGHRAGVTTVGATWGFRGAEELTRAGADYLANTPEEIVLLAGVGNHQ